MTRLHQPTPGQPENLPPSLKQTGSISIDAYPHGLNIKLEATALLLVDFQREFMDERGYMRILGNDPALLGSTIIPTKTLLESARALGIKVVFTREGHASDLSDCPLNKLELRPPGTRIGDTGPLGRFLIRGELGHQIIPELSPMDSETIIDKTGRDAFYRTNLEVELRCAGIENLIVGGVTTEVCVETTVRAGFDRGFRCLCVEDCCASYVRERHNNALESITGYGGIFCYKTNSTQLVEALQTFLLSNQQSGNAG